MKRTLLVALVAIASTAALAQALAGTLPRTSATQRPLHSGRNPRGRRPVEHPGSQGRDAGRGQVDGLGRMRGMDANGDGWITQREYNNFHASHWNKMKRTKGKVSMADMEAMLEGGPN